MKNKKAIKYIASCKIFFFKYFYLIEQIAYIRAVSTYRKKT